MPKADTMRVINSRTNGRMHASSAGAIYSGDGMADTLDGYDASKQPGPSLIPVALSDGKLDPGWLPEQATAGEGASATGGQVYIAPWVRLARAISETDTTIYLNGNIHAVGDQAVLGHYRYGNEGITITGGPVEQGTLYEYTVTRAATSRAYPAGSTVVFNLGGANDGGFITMVSGDQQQALVGPHLNMFAYEDGAAVRKVRIGRLQGLSAGEKAQFPKVEDWNVYGLYADAAYLRGQIVADSGDIAGDLDVGGTLGVWSGLGRAGVVLGNSEGGHGITLQNREGRPVFGAVSPYEDESGVLSDVAVWIDNKGEKGLYYHLDPATDEYRLEIGVNTLVDGTLTAANILAGTGAYPGTFTGMRFGAEGLQSFGTDYLPQIELDTQDGLFYFGGREGWLGWDGMTLDTRTYDTDKALLEHAVRWIHNTTRPTAPDANIGAAVGSGVSANGHGFVFMHTERSLHDLGIPTAAPDDFVQAGLMAFAGGTSTWYGQTLNISADSRLFIQAAGGQTSSFERDRAILPGLTVGSTLHSTDDGLTVGFGTQATGSAARVVIEQDNRPAFRAQRGDHYMTIALSSYIPSGQQSTGTGGYVMRANSTIGISTYANASADYNAVQDWLREHGLQPYTPQLGVLANQNIATQYDDGTGGLNWSQAAIDETALFPHPMIFDYGEFWYKTSPNALTWTIGGSPFTQDALPLNDLTTILTFTRNWFLSEGIANPWIMIDEPPHGTAPDWTQAIEDRVVKFTAAAVAAGFTVGVAVPGPTQLAYWRTRLTPTRWILAAKHERNEYATDLPSAQIWLYNRTNKAAGKPMTGLAQQMRDFGAVGYLHWSANSDVGTWPIVTCAGSPLVVTATDYGTQLIEELRLFAETDVPPTEPVYEQWFTTTGNMILNARSGYVLQPSGFPVSLGASSRPFEHVYAKHLHGALGSQIALVSGSSMYISAWSPVQAVGLEQANIVVYFEQSDLPVGKFLRATNPEDDSWEVVKVLSTGLPAGDWWEYELERGLDGLQQYWPEGTTWADLGGNAADGYVRLWGADDENPDTGPAIGIWQRDNDDAYDSTSLRFLAGNLNGFYDFTANTWGLAAGRHAGKWFSVTDEGGLRIMDASTQRAVYREYAQIGNPDANNVMITDSTLQLGTGSTYTISMDGSGDMDLTGTLAVASGGAITWAGGKGRADSDGIGYTYDANNFWHFGNYPDVNLFQVKGETSVNLDPVAEITASGSYQGVALSVYGNGGNVGIYAYSAATSTAAIEAFADYGIAIRATANTGQDHDGIALQIGGGIVDGGSQRYTALADATADTDAVNRQTGDGRWLKLDGSSTGATGAAQVFMNGIVGPSWKPAADSTTALQLQKANGTAVLTIDTTNGRVNASTRYDIGGVQMLYTVGTQNYWVGPAGNGTLSGNTNIGMGNGTLRSLTSGSGNAGIGGSTLEGLTSGSSNFGLGSNTLSGLTTQSGNVGIGANTGQYATTASSVLAGASAGQYLGGNNGVLVGAYAGRGVLGSTTAGELTAVGSSALEGVTTGGETVAIGFWSGMTTNPANATTTGSRCTYIGTYTGQASSTQRSGAIAIGYRAMVDANYTCVIGGVGSFLVDGVIGATTAGAHWDVVGGADKIQFRVKGHSSQTANLSEWHNSSGTVMTSIAPLGGMVINESGADTDTRIEGDTATSLLVLDAGLDAVQVGTTTAGVIADFRSAGIVFNEDGSDRDVRIEGDTDANNFFSDASADKIGIGTNAPTAKLDINSDVLRLRTAKTPATAGAAGNAGDICWDSGYIYVCTATNTWVRAALSTW